MSTDKKLRWGIISTADIGLSKVIPGIQKSAHSDVVAIASRDINKAKAAAAQLGIPKAYGSYQELLADPDIDAVYNPLPNHLHVELSVEAANAGKHVLCEKPMIMNEQEAAAMRQCSSDLLITEAFMVRYHPQWQRAREIVNSGELGEVRLITCVFTYFNDDPNNVRNMRDIGGGGILDIGCYAVVAARYIFGAEPKRVIGLVDRDPNFGTDRLSSVIADFGDGRQLSFACSTQAVPRQSVEILGTKGRVEITIPFNTPADQNSAILVDFGATLDGSLARREILPACDQYTEQAEAFAQAVLNQKSLPCGVEDAICQMRVLNAIFESEQSNGWVTVKQEG